jgi:hypothetical protein
MDYIIKYKKICDFFYILKRLNNEIHIHIKCRYEESPVQTHDSTYQMSL